MASWLVNVYKHYFNDYRQLYQFELPGVPRDDRGNTNRDGDGMDAQKREISKLVGERIRYFRRSCSISQEEAAFRAGLNPAYYGQVERGVMCPTVDTLYKISRALEVPLPELVRIEPPYKVPEGVANQADELLSRVPPDKIDQVLGLLEGIIELL